MVVDADTSFLFSLYAQDVNTPVLHVAAALALGAKEFYTFDARQKALDAKAGLKVKP